MGKKDRQKIKEEMGKPKIPRVKPQVLLEKDLRAALSRIHQTPKLIRKTKKKEANTWERQQKADIREKVNGVMDAGKSRRRKRNDWGSQSVE